MAQLAVLLIVLLIGCPRPHYPDHPTYQAWTDSGFFRPQGYEDNQLDSTTFFVRYVGYKNETDDPSQLKWVKGAQEYVLFRAAELSASKGAGWFLVLYREDWSLVGSIKYYRTPRKPVFYPGAALIIRILKTAPLELNPDVYEVNSLMENLASKNLGLARYRSIPVTQYDSLDSPVLRWRTSLIPFDPVPLTAEGLNISAHNPETKVTRLSHGRFELEMWGYYLLHPARFLGECVKLAEREGYDNFTLADWKSEEHFGPSPYIWFKISATVTLLREPGPHMQTVFNVKEIRPQVDINTIKRKRKAERDEMIDRDLERGLVY
jgi:hypothetical protein